MTRRYAGIMLLVVLSLISGFVGEATAGYTYSYTKIDVPDASSTALTGVNDVIRASAIIAIPPA